MIHRSVVTKLWINGRASGERRSELSVRNVMMSQRRRQRSRSESIHHQRSRGEYAVALRGRRIQITIERILRARGKMMKNKANRAADCLVTEMLQCLQTETVYEVACWFDKRLKGGTEAWKILRLVFLKKPDSKLEKALRGFLAIPLLGCVL